MAPSIFKQDSPTPDAAPRPTAVSEDSSAAERTRRRRADEPASLSVIGPGLEIHGEVRGRGDVQIEGRIEGRLELEGQARVSGGGRVEGDVVVDRLVVAGQIEGSITARDSAELLEGCRVDADVRSPRLTLASGATLNGRVDMSKPDAASNSSGTSRTGGGAKLTAAREDEAEAREGAA